MPDAPLKIRVESPRPDAAILRFEGPAIISHLFALQTEMRKQQAGLVVLDLAHVPYMDSSGLGAILNAYVSAQKSGRRVVIAGANDRIKALLQLTKVDSILECFADAQMALDG